MNKKLLDSCLEGLKNLHRFGCRLRQTLLVFVRYLPIRPVNKIQIVLTFESRLVELEIGLPVNSKVCQIAILKKDSE